MDNRFYSFIGLIQKSGNLTSGSDAVEMDIKRKKCKLLLITEDASDNTKKKFEDMAILHKISYVIIGTKEEIGKCIGKSERTVISIRSEDFANGLVKKIEQESAGGKYIVKNKNL